MIDRHAHPDASVVDAIIRSRRAIRFFREDAVARRVIEDILDVARNAPSNSNTQPWRVYALTGARKLALSEALRQAHDEDAHPPLRHMPDPLPDDMRSRQETFGMRYYGALGVPKSDLRLRSNVTARNYDFFGAPVGLIFAIDSTLTKYSWLDYGIFIQTVMLAARAVGLATCAQVSFARFQNVIADHLDFAPGYEVVCGMSLGFSDEEAAVNRIDMAREPVQKFSTFLGFD
ncbi:MULTISPECIES: nitroreductase [Caballeronia]|uniref:nitroreductase n=1 Tax=Caballeronia TaxID=1827195 RepID=UPI00045EE661|nr:nitroreductase [Caballeronia sp. CLC5]MCE4574353.1 nitroreductase [Caballeronia sp. CLC5]BAO89697.1 nitroreductase [Burkholderia sp. RPE67]BBP99737.1 nitroreductase [Burkholderia sp. SFA1]